MNKVVEIKAFNFKDSAVNKIFHCTQNTLQWEEKTNKSRTQSSIYFWTAMDKKKNGMERKKCAPQTKKMCGLQTKEICALQIKQNSAHCKQSKCMHFK